MLIGGLVTGAALLGGAGAWVAAYLPEGLVPAKPGQPVLEVLLDPGSTLSGSGDLDSPALAWSPDGRRVACTAMVGKPASKGVIVVDVTSGRTRWTHQEDGFWFDALAWSPHGTQLALARSSQPSSPPRPSCVQIWQVQGWQQVAQHPISTNDAQGQLAWSPDGSRLAGFNDIAYGQVQPSVQVWRASTGQVLFQQQATGFGGNLLLDWLPDSRRLATSWQQGELDIWDTRTGASLFHRDPDAPSASGNAVPLFLSGPDAAISPDGQRAALFTVEGGQPVVQLWDLSTASPLFSCQPFPGQSWCLSWSPDGNYLAACQSNSSPPSIRFWYAASGKLAFSYETLSFPDRLTWSPNGRFLAVIDNRQPGSFIFRPNRVNIVLRVLPVG
jgi:WD40 repeat protein